jgi:hypothetical protein
MFSQLHHHCIYTQESLRIECSPRNSVSFVCISIEHYPLLLSRVACHILNSYPSSSANLKAIQQLFKIQAQISESSVDLK